MSLDKGILVFVDFIRLEVKGEFKVVIYVVFQLEPCCNFSHARLFLQRRVFSVFIKYREESPANNFFSSFFLLSYERIRRRFVEFFFGYIDNLSAKVVYFFILSLQIESFTKPIRSF